MNRKLAIQIHNNIQMTYLIVICFFKFTQFEFAYLNKRTCLLSTTAVFTCYYCGEALNLYLVSVRA